MNIDMQMLMPVIVALIGAGGLWQLLSLKAKQGHEALMRDSSERTELDDTMTLQDDRLAAHRNNLVSEE